MSLHSENVLSAKLRRTDCLPDGSVRQIFDVVPCPGLRVVCIMENIEGQLEPVSQVYELPDGSVFDVADRDGAFSAWAEYRDNQRKSA